MIVFRAEEIGSLFSIVARHGIWNEPSRTGWSRDEPIAKDVAEIFHSIFANYGKILEDLELDAPLASLNKMLHYLDGASYRRFKDIYEYAEELSGRLSDQMKGRKYLALTLKESRLFERPLEGWETVTEKFQAATRHIEEANKCFALDRFAASVFHSLLIAEVGVIALGPHVGVTDPKEGWGPTRKALGRIVEGGHANATEFQEKHWNFFEQMHAAVTVLQLAWRDKVSHAKGNLAVMTSDFAPEVAEDILSATKGFMRRLAAELPAVEAQVS